MFLKIGKVIIESTVFLKKVFCSFSDPGARRPPSISRVFCFRRCFQALPLWSLLVGAWPQDGDYIDT